MKTLTSASRLHKHVCVLAYLGCVCVPAYAETHAYTQTTYAGKSETARSHAWDLSICEVEAGGSRGHS